MLCAVYANDKEFMDLIRTTHVLESCVGSPEEKHYRGYAMACLKTLLFFNFPTCDEYDEVIKDFYFILKGR